MPRPNGAQIRRRRIERGLTTSQLAARVGFTNEGSMRNIESRNDATSEIKLHRIARELGVPVHEVIMTDAAAPVGLHHSSPSMAEAGSQVRRGAVAPATTGRGGKP